jgi:hypothetical protein
MPFYTALPSNYIFSESSIQPEFLEFFTLLLEIHQTLANLTKAEVIHALTNILAIGEIEAKGITRKAKQRRPPHEAQISSFPEHERALLVLARIGQMRCFSTVHRNERMPMG